MSAIPETRTIGDRRRVNIPAEIAADYGCEARFEPDVRDGDIVLEPAEDGCGRVMSAKNRVRLPHAIAEQFAREAEFAVLRDGEMIVLRPTDEIDISI